jgi:hypothetical protein
MNQPLGYCFASTLSPASKAFAFSDMERAPACSQARPGQAQPCKWRPVRHAGRPFFVQCGTIEPRKNHLTILQVLRELVAPHGRSAPKLLLVGVRAWENENSLDLLDRSAAIPGPQGFLATDAGSQATSGSARALLMPSFARRIRPGRWPRPTPRVFKS